MTVKTELKTEIEKRGVNSIIRKVGYRLYKYTCSELSTDYQYKTKHTFLNDSVFKPLDQPKCWEDIIDNVENVPMCVLDDNVMESKNRLENALRNFFRGQCISGCVHKITQQK